MGRASRLRAPQQSPASPVAKTLDPTLYWKLRASIGDVDRAAVEVEKANTRLKELIQARTTLLGEAAPGVDLNFLSHVDWDDPKCQITLYGVVERKNISTDAVK